MDLDKIAIRLRPRNSWEGIDLGFAMAREWFTSLWLLWLCSALPVMAILTLLPLPLWLAGLLLWWLKPVYEPPLLFWMSRRVFSEQTPVSTVFKGWTKVVLPQLIAALTWRRFSPSRSFFMPVVVLEGLRGKRRSRRIAILGRSGHAAPWLTMVGIHFEVILQFGLIGLIAALIPEDLLWTDWQSYFLEPDPLTEWLHHLCALAAMSLIAPFYVAGGFALYLTRRSQLEAWDLELGLRQLARRHQSRRGLAGSLSALCLALMLGITALPETARAMELSRQTSQELIQEVLEDEAFGRNEERHYWEYVGEDDEEPEQEKHSFLLWLEAMAIYIASIGEVLLWLLFGAVLAYLIYWYAQNKGMLRRAGNGEREGRDRPPQVVAGLDLRPESLPDDPASAAARLIDQGDDRAGLALLYRAALSVLVHRYALPIREGDTEGTCLQQARGIKQPGLDDYFSHLTGVWQRLAYAHRRPEKAQALALCQAWREHFEVSHVG